MNRELYFYHDLQCYVVRWVGDLSTEAMTVHWRDLLDQPDYRPEHAGLHDVRGREINAGYSDTVESREIYERDVAPRVGGGRVAILVDNAAAFGTGRQLTVMTGLEDASLVTYSEEDAKKWIGLASDFALPYDVET